MKIGSASMFRRRAGDEHYKKMKLYGFDYVDYAISGALDGKTEEGNALRQQAIDFVWKNEDKMQGELDSMYFHRMINERIKIDSEAVFTGV